MQQTPRLLRTLFLGLLPGLLMAQSEPLDFNSPNQPAFSYGLTDKNSDPRVFEALQKAKEADELEQQHKFGDSDTAHAAAIALAEAVYGIGSKQVVPLINNRANMLLRQGRSDRAESIIRPALAAAELNDGPASENALKVTATLVSACVRQGKKD